MKISIYQIAIERDANRLAFRSLEHMTSAGGGRIPAELYDCVYTGEVAAETLEDIFYIFNAAHPLGYKGRSLCLRCGGDISCVRRECVLFLRADRIQADPL